MVVNNAAGNPGQTTSINLMGKRDLLDKYRTERTMCLQWTRVMGYYRPALLPSEKDGAAPIEGYNHGKMSEFRERVYFRGIGGCGCRCACEATA